MNCEGVRPLLSAYIDQELSPGELLRVEQHLRRCPACAAEVDALRQTVALVASLDAVEVPATFHAQLHQRLLLQEPPLSRASRTGRGRARLYDWRRWAIPAAAAAALVIGAAGLNRLSPPAAQPERPPGESVAAAPESPANVDRVPGTAGPVSAPVTEQPTHPVGGSSEQPPSETGGTAVPPQGQPNTSPEPGLPTGEEQPPASETGGEGPAETQAPVGPASPGRNVTTASVSGETGEQTALAPQPQLSAAAEVAVASPAAEAEQVRARLGRWRVQENGQGRTVRLQIFVPAAEFSEAVALVNDALSAHGAALTVEEKDLAGQLAEAEARIAQLEESRQAQAARLEGEVSPEGLQEAARQLAEIEQQLAMERASYQKLREAVEEGVIVLTFKPGTGQ